jgi:intracellular multiplication protein IcmX
MLLALPLLALSSMNAAADGVSDVYVVGSQPLENFSAALQEMVLAVACSMGYVPDSGSGTSCPDNNSQYSYDYFNNNNFLSGLLFTNNLATPFSLGSSALYQLSSDDDIVTSVTAPSLLLDYFSTDEDLSTYTNYIFGYNDEDADWWYTTYDMGYYDSSSNTIYYSDTASGYGVESSNQTQYLGNPTALSVLNALVLPFSCVSASDATTCLSDTVFPRVQLAAVNQVIDLSGNTTPATDLQPYYVMSDLQTELPESYSHLQSLSALNMDTLLSPLMYKTSVETAPSSSDESSGVSLPAATAENELEAATSFIKYVTDQYISIPPLTSDAYTGVTGVQTIYTYMTQLRGYAALLSVPVSNLNFLLAKRIQPTNNDEPKISQSAYEYNMATRRLQTISCSSGGSSGSGSEGSGQSCDSEKTPVSWIQKVRLMSPNQREAEELQLLAEINYQLYLNRQIMERLLATGSAGLANSIAMGKQNLTLDNAADVASLLTTGESTSSDDSSSDSSS